MRPSSAVSHDNAVSQDQDDAVSQSESNQTDPTNSELTLATQISLSAVPRLARDPLFARTSHRESALSLDTSPHSIAKERSRTRPHRPSARSTASRRALHRGSEAG
eukprot:2108383-Rhodomonas_salina.1